MPKQKHQPHPATPTQQDFEQDRFYYNNKDDEVEVLEALGYNPSSNEEQRVSKFW